jgi:hypothetical protein
MISVLAVVVTVATTAVLVISDRRQPATNTGRRKGAEGENAARGPSVPQDIEGPRGRPLKAVAGTPYRPPRWYRRLGSILGIGIVAAVVGALLAIALAVLVVVTLLTIRQAVG